MTTTNGTPNRPPPNTASSNNTIRTQQILRIIFILTTITMAVLFYSHAQLMKRLAMQRRSPLYPKDTGGRIVEKFLRESKVSRSAMQRSQLSSLQRKNDAIIIYKNSSKTRTTAIQEDEDDHPHPADPDHILSNDASHRLPEGFRNVLERAREKQQDCHELKDVSTTTTSPATPADLPNLGIIDALSNYRPASDAEAQQWQCQVPPADECKEDKFTVIFLGYRPDRLSKMKKQIFAMTAAGGPWSSLVKEVILVWNGERDLKESKEGQHISDFCRDRPVRIVFPLQEGLPNDLMNRYHPHLLNVTTKAIQFYDDDGPFYSLDATVGGFELWKRNSNAEIGAMARRIDLSHRQELEFHSLLPHEEHEFVSHCRSAGDAVRYNFQHFAQFGARMALPSGSFLHRDFLCFLWHPALEELRAFVRAHPVHPDDVTVSTIVSHVSGRSPKVYSRRINPRLDGNETDLDMKRRNAKEGRNVRRQKQKQQRDPARRRLLWDDEDHGEWAKKRESAVNSVISYFGSITSGSLGWCYQTPYHDMQDDTCVPEMARYGMIPWMTKDHQAKETCP